MKKAVHVSEGHLMCSAPCNVQPHAVNLRLEQNSHKPTPMASLACAGGCNMLT